MNKELPIIVEEEDEIEQELTMYNFEDETIFKSKDNLSDDFHTLRILGEIETKQSVPCFKNLVGKELKLMNEFS